MEYKHDKGKLRWDILPINATEEVVKVLNFGANKYGTRNWCNVEPVRWFNGVMRHIAAYMKGEHLDPETGLPHLAHAACSLLFILELTGGYQCPEKNT